MLLSKSIGCWLVCQLVIWEAIFGAYYGATWWVNWKAFSGAYGGATWWVIWEEILGAYGGAT